MTTTKRNRVSVKIYEETRDALEAAKMRLPRPERPDYADVIESAVADLLGGKRPIAAPDAKNQRWHALLDAILLHAPPQISAHVKQVLEIHSEHLGKGKSG